METIGFALAMKRLGAEYIIIGKMVEELLERLKRNDALICAGLWDWIESPPDPSDILSGKQPFPLDAIRRHAELCPSCALLPELEGELIHLLRNREEMKRLCDKRRCSSAVLSDASIRSLPRKDNDSGAA